MINDLGFAELVNLEGMMRGRTGWAIPLICFLIFVSVIIGLCFLSNSKVLNFESKDYGSVTNVQDFQKALDSSLK